LNGIFEEKENLGNNHRRNGGEDEVEQHEEEMRLRKKELEAQKARIVAQMAPVREDPEVEEAPVAVAPKPQERVRERYGVVDRENVVPVPKGGALASKHGSLRDRGVIDKENTGNFIPFYGIASRLLMLLLFHIRTYTGSSTTTSPPCSIQAQRIRRRCSDTDDGFRREGNWAGIPRSPSGQSADS
jgi:hypothetical protein